MATKKTAATEDAFSFASMDPAKLTESYREFAEKGLVQSKVEEKKDEKKEAAEACTGVARKESNWRSMCC